MTTALIDEVASAPRTARAVDTARARWPEDPATATDKTFLESVTPFITAAGYAHVRG